MLGLEFVKFLMSVLKWQVNSSLDFASFFIVMTHNSSVDFKLILFLLWIKGSHQSPNFETFKWFGENLPYSSCHFPNHNSVFLQILHHPSVSWKTTPLYFVTSNIKYFSQLEQRNVHVLESFGCSGQISPNSCHFWNRSVFLQIFDQFSG